AQEVVLPAYQASGSCHGVAYQFVTKEGDVKDIQLSAISECDYDGTFLRSLAVLLDVTDGKQIEQALIKKTTALERSNADLKQIAQIASHDLQEPLRRVVTYCDILKQDFSAQLPKGAAEIADIIQSGGRRLRLVINDLLNYVRIREQLDRAFEPVDMSAVICHALDELQDELASQNARIDVAHLPLVWGRAPLLKMVCHHLLSNAIRHGGGESPAIDVTVGDAGDLWRFAVTDRGMGVEARFADRIFDIFQRLHHDEACEGSGAGLAICRLVIQRCGGDIWLDRSYQDGARFLFTLPKDKPDAFDASSGASLPH
ncbi:MAG: sensor histidine kinase, partial [Geminicoccaceae bacterium]